MGFTTEIQLDNLTETLKAKYLTTATIAHKREAAEKIFRIGKFAWDNLPPEFKAVYRVKYNNVRELLFDATLSSYFVSTEARSGTIHRLHVSEAAFVEKYGDLVASTFETVPRDGIITLESTANGLNHYYDEWEKAMLGKSEFKPFFYNWTWDEGYQETTPADDRWKGDYIDLARAYNLITDIQKQFNLTDEQFYWYFLKARRLQSLVKQEYPTNAEEAFLSNNASVFDLFKVSQIVGKPRVNQYLGFEIFYEPEPEHHYIIGIDTAEGVEGDGTGIAIIDATDLKEVAVFYDNKIRPDQTAELAIKMAKYYQGAYIVPERNSSGLTTVLKLQELGYTNVYRDRTIDKITKKRKDQMGFRTTSVSRDVLIDDFVEKFDNGEIEINSSIVISQMKTFVRKDNGKREHEEEKHDDALFALFLAVQGLKYYRGANAYLDYYKNQHGQEEKELHTEVGVKLNEAGDQGFTVAGNNENQ